MKKLFFILLSILIVSCVKSPTHKCGCETYHLHTTIQKLESKDNKKEIIKENINSVVVVGNSGGFGSGFLVFPGVVITNYHIIKGFDDNFVKTINERYYNIRVISFSAKEDIAILFLDEVPQEDQIQLFEDTKFSVGDDVLVIGHPNGFEHIVSTGIISGYNSGGKTIAETMQITAPISQGSSGSPVFNMNGEIVGMVRGIVSNAQNLNIIIPIDKLLKVLNSNNKLYTPEEFKALEYKGE